METIANLLGGGLLGALSSMVNGWFKLKEEKDKREFQLKLIEAEAEAAVIESEAQIKLQRSITEGEISKAEMEAEAKEMSGRNRIIERLTGRYLSDDTIDKMMEDNSLVGKLFRPLLYVHILFMDAVRGLIRPIVTAGSIGFSFYVFVIAFEAYEKLGGVNNTELLLNTVILPMVNLLLFVVSTVIGFWFADKSASRRFQVGLKR